MLNFTRPFSPALPSLAFLAQPFIDLDDNELPLSLQIVFERTTYRYTREAVGGLIRWKPRLYPPEVQPYWMGDHKAPTGLRLNFGDFVCWYKLSE